MDSQKEWKVNSTSSHRARLLSEIHLEHAIRSTVDIIGMPYEWVVQWKYIYIYFTSTHSIKNQTNFSKCFCFFYRVRELAFRGIDTTVKYERNAPRVLWLRRTTITTYDKIGAVAGKKIGKTQWTQFNKRTSHFRSSRAQCRAHVQMWALFSLHKHIFRVGCMVHIHM